MFYLKTFYQSILRKPVSGILFLILFIGVMFSMINHNRIQNFLVGKMGAKNENLISLKAVYLDHKIRDKARDLVKSLPGIKSIESSQSSKRKLENLSFKEVGTLKMTLDPMITKQNASLIRSYLKKNFSSRELIVSSLKLPSKAASETMDKALELSKKYLLGFYVFMSLCLTFSFYSLSLNLFQFTYIIEEFQRKKYVFQKTVFSGILFLLSIVLLAQKVIYGIDIKSLYIPTLILTVLFSALSLNLILTKKNVKVY